MQEETIVSGNKYYVNMYVIISRTFAIRAHIMHIILLFQNNNLQRYYIKFVWFNFHIWNLLTYNVWGFFKSQYIYKLV